MISEAISAATIRSTLKHDHSLTDSLAEETGIMGMALVELDYVASATFDASLFTELLIIYSYKALNLLLAFAVAVLSYCFYHLR